MRHRGGWFELWWIDFYSVSTLSCAPVESNVIHNSSAIKSALMTPIIFNFCWHCHRGVNFIITYVLALRSQLIVQLCLTFYILLYYIQRCLTFRFFCCGLIEVRWTKFNPEQIVWFVKILKILRKAVTVTKYEIQTFNQINKKNVFKGRATNTCNTLF